MAPLRTDPGAAQAYALLGRIAIDTRVFDKGGDARRDRPGLARVRAEAPAAAGCAGGGRGALAHTSPIWERGTMRSMVVRDARWSAG